MIRRTHPSILLPVLAIFGTSLGTLRCSTDPGAEPSSGGVTSAGTPAVSEGGAPGGTSGAPFIGGTSSGAGTSASGTPGTNAGSPGAGAAGRPASESGGAPSNASGGTNNGTNGGEEQGGTAGAGKAGAGAGPVAGAGSGGSAGAGDAPFNPPFILGADISSVHEGSSTFRDTDGQTKTIFEVLKNHGFNYIRVKTFVDPSAPYGYASKANGCSGLSEPFSDRDHVVAFGKQIKAAGMGFLLDFHYSDVWADPGNQIIPAAWRNAKNVTELASLVKAYTKDVLTTAVAQGARPDMVQVGNETTPGMLAHVPGSNTDCWGNNADPAPAAISGSTSNWDNLATLLKAGIAGVKEVDPRIQVMLHIENTRDLAGVRRWVDSALARDVEFDVLGLSCYVAWQGQPSVWKNTFESLATNYPNLKFAIAEYNPERTQANRIMKALPNGRGLGTFFWEPTRSGEWGDSMFTWQGNTATANSADFAEYDELRSELGL